jgi:receptor protein-tyrosine kinase
MSLVERAAKRLEELGKAGTRTAGEQVPPRSQDEALAPGLVELAARKLDAADAKRIKPEVLPQPAPETARVTIASDDVDRGDSSRREPTLGEAIPGLSTPASAVRPMRGAPRKGPSVELDLSRLASAGYLKPDDPESMIANEFRKIKRPLIQACQGKLAAPVEHANRIMVTSSLPGEGKSFVSLNLALSIAMERDSTVLLIDADTTRHRLSQLVGIDALPGLLDLLAGGQLDVSDTLFATNIDRLTILPAGGRRRHATELLASEDMERLVEHLASRYADRILIFDAPPLLGASEPAVLASHMGQIIVVVEADRTTHKVLRDALTTVQSCPVVSTVLNKASGAGQGYYYYAA